MNKKGFTLVELLGTIVILSLLALITFPVVNSIVKSSKKQITNSNVITILDSAYSWAVDEDNDVLLPENNNESITVTLGDLKHNGKLKKEAKNVMTEENYDDSCVITITKKAYDKDEVRPDNFNEKNKYYNDYLFTFGC